MEQPEAVDNFKETVFPRYNRAGTRVNSQVSDRTHKVKPDKIPVLSRGCGHDVPTKLRRYLQLTATGRRGSAFFNGVYEPHSRAALMLKSSQHKSDFLGLKLVSYEREQARSWVGRKVRELLREQRISSKYNV